MRRGWRRARGTEALGVVRWRWSVRARPMASGSPPANVCMLRGTNPRVRVRHAQEHFGAAHGPVVAGLPRQAVRRRTEAGRRGARDVVREHAFSGGFALV
jgi:hypothetical protein